MTKSEAQARREQVVNELNALAEVGVTDAALEAEAASLLRLINN